MDACRDRVTYGIANQRSAMIRGTSRRISIGWCYTKYQCANFIRVPGGFIHRTSRGGMNRRMHMDRRGVYRRGV